MNIPAVCLAAALKLTGLWFFITALFFRKRAQTPPRVPARTRFACLIPARNEEAAIAASVRSLLAQRYPRELFDVYAIPNNCDDGTERAAGDAGARILRCSGAVRSKGEALRQAVARLLPEGYDAFCVFDADNTAAPDALPRMNDAFCAGARVVKARGVTKNPREGWVAGCYALYFSLFEGFYNPSRAALGLSARLAGTGFAVSRELLEELGGWNSVSIAEDAEFAALCAEKGVRVTYLPGAVSYDEAPASFALSLRQRRRWSYGVMQTGKRALPALLRALPRRSGAARWRALDMIFFLSSPFCQVLSPLCALLASPFSPRALLTALASGWLGTALFGVILMLLLPKENRPALKSAALFPLFLWSWLPLHLASLLRPVRRWKPIPHGGNRAGAKSQELRVKS